MQPNSEKAEEKEVPQKHEAFKMLVKEAAETFRQIPENETIRYISHLDADGLSSAAVIVKTLLRENRKYCLSIVPQLTEEVAMQLAAENYNSYLFTDLGTGQFDVLKKHLAGRKVFILDHHHLQGESQADGFVHVNPHISGIESSRDISGAGVSYLFSKALDSKNIDIAHVALIGAIGDMQEDKGFTGFNKEILEDAKKADKIKVITGLRLFGVQTKPLHKILEYSSEFPIPGVTGSESAAIHFLQQLGISPKNGSGWRKLTDLADEELVKLATGVVLQRINEPSPEAIIGPVYIMKHEAEGPLKDAREFATLLNACGRLGKSSSGIGACLGDEKSKQEALKHLDSYKQQISSSLSWYENALKQNSMASNGAKSIILESGLVIINAEENVLPTMIGTLASIVSKSSYMAPGTFVLSLARAEDNFTKVSFRVAGEKLAKDELNLMELLGVIASRVGGRAGGHHEAAGAIIKTEKEQEFIETARRYLTEKRLEENI